MRAASAGGALLLILMGPSLVPVAAHEEDHAPGDPLRINYARTFLGADTYMFSIRSAAAFNLLAGSFFRVTAFLDLNEDRQDFAAFAGIRRNINGGCLNAAGEDPCFFLPASASIKDMTDFTFATNGNVHFRNDPNIAQWGGGEVEMSWDGPTGFQRAAGDPVATFTFIISVPGARRLDVNVHLHSQQMIAVNQEVAHAGGFYKVAEDYAPTVFVDTQPAEVAWRGEHTVTVPPGAPQDYFYAIEAPSWYGTTGDPGGTITHNTAALSTFGVELPNGDTKETTALAVANEGDFVAIYGVNTPGNFRFYQRVHAGVGPQDLYTVGTLGPIAN